MSTIEDTVFARKRFLIGNLEPFGFVKGETCYTLTSDFMDGEFEAVLSVYDDGSYSGMVIDKMNDEEYAPLRFESFKGSYVSSVRSAYTEFLEWVAKGCCVDVLFASDQANRLTDHIFMQYEIKPDFPFGQSQYQNYGTFRHAENGKWFALVMNVKWHALLKNGCEDTIDIVNLKIKPNMSLSLCSNVGIYPAYHMNHKNWISVVLDDTLNDNEVFHLLEDSYSLTR
ncbi:MAG: hypothetical protein E7003_02720 [Eggerthellaceae bacterium]|nr:hypothetical protein [Eggerthellaceae bacterium]